MKYLGQEFLKQFQKNKLLISYAIFGVLTTALNIIIYQVMILVVDYKIGNLIAIISSKIFAYVANKKFVFKTKCATKAEWIKEAVRYIITRGFTALIDYFGVIFLVEVFHLNESYVKYFVLLIVVVLNYILGKNAVFISGTSQNTEETNQK